MPVIGDRFEGPQNFNAQAATSCVGSKVETRPKHGRGRGFSGRGFGGGRRGWRHWFYATGQPGWMRFGGYPGFREYPAAYRKPDPELEKQALKTEAEALQSELEAIQKRLSEIEAAAP